MDWKQGAGIAAGLTFGILLAINDSRAQGGVPCRAVPNGSNNTIVCANGYWITTTPDGETFTGMGIQDPNATMQGSKLGIDPTTGGPVTNINRGPAVQAPTQQPTMNGPGAQQYGLYPRLE